MFFIDENCFQPPFCFIYLAGGPNSRDSINLMVAGVSLVGAVCLECIPPTIPICRVTDASVAIVRLSQIPNLPPLGERVFHISGPAMDSSLLFQRIPKRVPIDEWQRLLAVLFLVLYFVNLRFALIFHRKIRKSVTLHIHCTLFEIVLYKQNKEMANQVVPLVRLIQFKLWG
jgi:hypothetical protein